MLFMSKEMFMEKNFQICRPNIYTSFGTFLIQIGQKSEPKWVLEDSW